MFDAHKAKPSNADAKENCYCQENKLKKKMKFKRSKENKDKLYFLGKNYQNSMLIAHYNRQNNFELYLFVSIGVSNCLRFLRIKKLFIWNDAHH